MDVRSVLIQCGLTDAHFEALAAAVPEGYLALSELVKATPMLRQFPGLKSICYLRNVAVQYALEQKAAETKLFYTETGMHPSNRQAFLKLQVGQVIITSQYCGPNGSRTVRKAIRRAELCQRIPDLFKQDSEEPDIQLESKRGYAQLIHGGLSEPVLSALRIPNRYQGESPLAPMLLPIIRPNQAASEQIKDQLMQTFEKKSKKGGQRDVG